LKRSSNRAPGYIKGAALISKQIAPATCPRRLTRRIPSKGNGTRARYHDNSRSTLQRTGERDLGVVRNLVMPGWNHVRHVFSFVLRAPAKAQAGGFEENIFKRNRGFATGLANSAAYSVSKALNRLASGDMVARAGNATPENNSGTIANYRFSAGLSTVDAEIKFGAHASVLSFA
jgi:hypothetical protein